MKNREKLNRILAVGLVIVLTLVPNLALAQGSAATSAQASGRNKAPSGPQEGIKIHGHWTIVIKNPDGSVLSRHEFENALVPGGSDMLAQLLGRTTTTGGWGISLLPSTPGGSSCGGNLPCVVIEPGIATGVISVSSNLTVAYSPNPSRTTLQGSYQASSAGDISVVSTLLGACAPSLTPAACPSASNNLGQVPFSSRTLTTPIPVQSGQIVQLTVTFTFS